MVSGGQSTEPFQRKRWTKASDLERRELQWSQQYTFTICRWQRLAWQAGHQLQLQFICNRPAKLSPGFIYPDGASIVTQYLPNQAFSMLHRLRIRFINSILDISSPHTFPSSRARLTGNHPMHLGTGSSRWTLQPLGGRCNRGSSLCSEDFSTHQALQGLICGRGWGCKRGSR